MDSLWTPSNITPLDATWYEATGSSISQNIFSYIIMFSMQCKKNITVENNIRKRMNIAKFTNIYTYLYTYNIRDKNGLHKLQEATSNTAIIEK